ncbi:hypothetical protein Lesp02_17210 [Lentzea sp. NBRC 105346]|nr:hypothetical protein Lesp02_17210 [Lentzea sp. NBRC 105346]
MTDRLADLRRSYTGENLSQAVPAVRAGSPLIPAASSVVQAELESRLLIAASAASSYLQFRPPASIIRPAHVFTAVSPGANVRLHLSPDALGPLLYELVPRVEAGFPMGVQGLSYVQHRRSAELRLGAASAVLSGVDAAAWARGMRWVEWMVGFRGLDTVLWTGGVNDPVPELATGSALLRRVNLFASASWIRVLPRDPWFVEWAGGPSVDAVEAALRHPLGGADVSFGFRRQETPAVDIDPDLRTWPWPAEFVSVVTD